jgi:hypothetical protein
VSTVVLSKVEFAGNTIAGCRALPMATPMTGADLAESIRRYAQQVTGLRVGPVEVRVNADHVGAGRLSGPGFEALFVVSRITPGGEM